MATTLSLHTISISTHYYIYNNTPPSIDTIKPTCAIGTIVTQSPPLLIPTTMTSHLRYQSSFEEPIVAQTTFHHHTTQPRPAKKARMSLTQTYAIASSARTKLSREAGYADHRLRYLVGHANLLDQLMVELADAERESENWLNQSIREAAKPAEPRRVQWLDSIAEEYDNDDEEEEDEEEEFEHTDLFTVMPKIKQAPVFVSTSDDDAVFDIDSEDEDLVLTRSPDSQYSPPELTLDDSDSEYESEDDEAPVSPKDTPLQLSDKQRQAITTTAYFDLKSEAQQSLEDYLLDSPSQQPLIAAC